MTYAEDCIFCKFAKHKIDTAIIFENKDVVAFLDNSPAGNLVGHTLVLPKKHYETIDKIPDKELGEVIKVIKILLPAITKISGADGINVIQNNGKAAGQAIPHAHFHIIPRKHGDGIYFDEKRRKSVPMELVETAKAIKEELTKQ
ncbi:MAG: HIT domain-containing protein [archaeon]|jgi:histidine triad (HIT) family protein